MAISKKSFDLGLHQKNIRLAVEDSKPNIDRYHLWRDYLFRTTLTEAQRAILNDRMFPTIEFNIGEEFVNRLRGEFGEQQPSVSISAAGANSPSYEELQFLEDHFRYRLHDFHTDAIGFKVISQTLSGGLSVIIAEPDYLNPMSMQQDIFFRCPNDPTTIIFDPDAKESHKGDGSFCTELIPMTYEKVKSQFGKKIADKINYKSSFNTFNFAYKNFDEKVAVLCSHYYKEYKECRIGDVVGLGTMTLNDYEKLLDRWAASGNPYPAPAIKGKTRKTVIDIINQVQFFDDLVVYHQKKDFRYLPFIFVDGNSAWLREGKNGALYQYTRPYIYNLRGAQDFKNFSAQTWANYIENIIQSKYMIPQGGIPYGAEIDYKDPQNAGNLMYNPYQENDPDKPLPPPAPIQQPPMPQEVTNAFGAMDQTAQMVLGSFDASLGINDNQLSGKAIKAGAMQSNPTSKPYIFNYMQALNRTALVYLDMYPKIVLKGDQPVETYIKEKNGKSSPIVINDYANHFKYDIETISIKIEAGPSFAMQKQIAMEQIIGLIRVSPKFAEFMNTNGLPFLLKNLDFEGADQLAALAESWVKQEQEMMEQQREQMKSMPNPEMAKIELEIKKLVQQAMKDEKDAQLKERDLDIKQQAVDTNKTKVLADIEQKSIQGDITKTKALAEITKAEDELEMKKLETKHTHALDIIDRHHENHHKNIEHAKDIVSMNNSLNSNENDINDSSNDN